MKKIFAHTLTLISGFVILGLASIVYFKPEWMPQWLKDHDDAKLNERVTNLKSIREKLETKEKELAAAYILKAQMLELKYDFENAETNYLKAVSIFPSFENNLQVEDFYYKLNKFQT